MRFPVVVRIGSSRRLRAALVFVHAAAAGALVFSALRLVAHPPALPASLAASFPLAVLPLAVALVFLLACLPVFLLLRQLRPSPPIRYRLGDDGTLSRIDREGEPVPLEILPGGFVAASLVVIRVREEGKGVTGALTVLADSLPASDFRALRLWLRWRARFSGARAVVA
ncbi:MAG: hypothetical protein RBT86_05175 [Azospira sp.]|nr:hypothetical protein [Azospira sp.]